MADSIDFRPMAKTIAKNSEFLSLLLKHLRPRKTRVHKAIRLFYKQSQKSAKELPRDKKLFFRFLKYYFSIYLLNKTYVPIGS